MTKKIKNLTDAAFHQGRVFGHMHDFYSYPARFSPEFVRFAIAHFTKPGDLIIDPFVGSGTTLVEAKSLSRDAIGYDINELAVFLSRVKTTILSSTEIRDILNWSYSLSDKLNLHNKPKIKFSHQSDTYLKHMYLRQTWPVRKLAQLYIGELCYFKSDRITNFLRAVLLKTLQWAVDGKREVPPIENIRRKLFQNLNYMLSSLSHYRRKVNSFPHKRIAKIDVHHRSAEFINLYDFAGFYRKPKLVITSPPYPGVHVLYHRWQLFGRKETAIPYLIADCYDGQGETYYTLGSRFQPQLTNYWLKIYRIFSALKKVVSKDTVIIQMLAFSNIDQQLSMYLQTMSDVGFKETEIIESSNISEGRIWRNVPNRKWYNYNKKDLDSSREVVLFHKLQ